MGKSSKIEDYQVGDNVVYKVAGENKPESKAKNTQGEIVKVIDTDDGGVQYEIANAKSGKKSVKNANTIVGLAEEESA